MRGWSTTGRGVDSYRWCCCQVPCYQACASEQGSFYSNTRETMLPGCKWEELGSILISASLWWNRKILVPPGEGICSCTCSLWREAFQLLKSSIWGQRELDLQHHKSCGLIMDLDEVTSVLSLAITGKLGAYPVHQPSQILLLPNDVSFVITQRAPGFLFTCSNHMNRLWINKHLIP